MAGLSTGTRAQYLSSVNELFKVAWLEPASLAERDVQEFLVALPGQGVARETFRGWRYALQFLFANTLGRDWALFKKN